MLRFTMGPLQNTVLPVLRQPMIRISVCLLIGGGSLISAAFAQDSGGQGLGLMAGNSEGPIEIDAAGSIEWDRNRKVYEAKGDAHAKRGQVEISSELLSAYYRESAEGGSEIWQIEAEGGVLIESENEKASGDNAIYNVDKGIMVMRGRDLWLTTATDRLTATDSMEYWEREKYAVARGNAFARRADRKISADVLKAIFIEDTKGDLVIEKVEAYGDVCIESQKTVARGAQGVYFASRGKAILDHNVRVQQGPNKLTGARAEVDLNTGISKVLPGRSAPPSTSGRKDRVIVVIDPRSQATAPDQGTVSPAVGSKVRPCG